MLLFSNWKFSYLAKYLRNFAEEIILVTAACFMLYMNFRNFNFDHAKVNVEK